MMRGSLQGALTADLGKPVSPDATRFGHAIADAFGTSCLAVMHYGSRLHRAPVRRGSAYDFFVIIESVRDAFETFERRQQPHFSARTAGAVAGVLPPSVVGVAGPDGASHRAKCVVLTLDDLESACSEESRDHFTKGRVAQPMRFVWCRDAAAKLAVEHCLAEARAGSIVWVRPRLAGAFSVEDYCAVLLDTSYRAEIRLEPPARAREVAAAHGAALHDIYAPLLDHLHARGELLRDGATYRLVRAVTREERMRVNGYLTRSKVRGVMRWPKSALLYDGWFDYVRGKAGRLLAARNPS